MTQGAEGFIGNPDQKNDDGSGKKAKNQRAPISPILKTLKRVLPKMGSIKKTKKPCAKEWFVISLIN